MKLVFAIAAAAALVAAYVMWVRPYLRSLPSLGALWAKEDTSWGVIKAWFDGRKTILVGIWGEIIAFLPDALQSASGFDLKTLLMLPDAWAAYVTALIPVVMVILRAQASKL